MRPSPPRPAVRRPLHVLGSALFVLAMSALPAHAAPADPEALPIPEGSSTPTALSGGAGGTLLRLGLGLVVVLGLIALVWYVMKRVQRSRFPALDERGPSLIDVVATTSLGPNRSLHLVRIGEEIVLVGATDHAINAIVRIGAEDVAGVPELAPARAGFGRPAPGAGGMGSDDRARAVATAVDGSIVERLRAMTTRR